MKEGIGLLELQKKIKEKVVSAFSSFLWVKAEINAINVNSSGHCYLDLIEKGNNGLNAQVRGIIWSSSWKILNPYFQESTGKILEKGMCILFKAQVQYSELYGLSLVIYDIDTEYNIGEQERLKQLTIIKLKEEGMFDMNTSLALPRLPKRLAIISSEAAAGYRDFMVHLRENIYGFQFYTKLFSSPMQGNDAPEGIILSLEKIADLYFNRNESFDAVLIIRGGGSNTDLSCFDSYDLAVNIAQFPLPVFMAVGHDHNYHISDMVARISVKTPTALADYLIDVFMNEDMMVSSLSSRISMAVNSKYSSVYNELYYKFNDILSRAKRKIEKAGNKLDEMEGRIDRGNPISLLKAGYSIAEKGGIKITSTKSLDLGDEISLYFKDGKLDCKVIDKKKYGK